MDTFCKIAVISLLLALGAVLLILGCEEDDGMDFMPPQLSHCESVQGFCGSGTTGCGEKHVGWCPWGCPDPAPDGDFGMCCIPINSCAAVGGVCRLLTEPCPSGTGGTVYMDCPQGNLGQCCIPFE
jgi:hypothetical protein